MCPIDSGHLPLLHGERRTQCPFFQGSSRNASQRCCSTICGRNAANALASAESPLFLSVLRSAQQLSSCILLYVWAPTRNSARTTSIKREKRFFSGDRFTVSVSLHRERGSAAQASGWLWKGEAFVDHPLTSSEFLVARIRELRARLLCIVAVARSLPP